MVYMQKAGEARVPRYKICTIFPGLRAIVSIAAISMISISAYQCYYYQGMLHKAIFYAVILVPIFLIEEERLVLFCFGLDGFLCRLLRPMFGVHGLIRGVIYAMLSAVILMKSLLGQAPLCQPTGILLAVLAALYLIKPLETKKTNLYIKQGETTEVVSY